MNILGIDEAGRGAFAGPLVAAGVIVSPSQKRAVLKERLVIRDSKKLSETQREAVFRLLQQSKITFFTAVLSVDDINTYGIGWANYQAIKEVQQSFLANHHAMELASHTPGVRASNHWISEISLTPFVTNTQGKHPWGVGKVHRWTSVVVDGKFPLEKISINGLDIRCQVDADATIFEVILAGIVAKVTRDRIMYGLHEQCGIYGWNENKGYGTKHHRDQLALYGETHHHRKDFIRSWIRR